MTLGTKVIRTGAGVAQTKKDEQTGRDLKLTGYIVPGHTGEIRLVSWEDNIPPLNLGVTCEVAHAKFVSYEGSLYLSAGRNSKVKQVDDIHVEEGNTQQVDKEARTTSISL